MIHPSNSELALYGGGDLSFWRRLRVRQHVAACASCRLESERHHDVVLEVRALQPELPPGLDWERLSAEMTANIHLGLEAGECVTRPARVTHRASWRAAAVMASMCVVLAFAWWLNPPAKRVPALRGPHVEIRTTSAGLELNENGNALVLMHPTADKTQKPIIVSAPGTLRSRFVDSETGQITINNVYAE